MADGTASPSDLEKMIVTLRHRGPDGLNHLYRHPCMLAHARLSIIDPETGAQPIAHEDETVWMVLNGEIFNYIELRAELVARGHRFRTRSDAEVIVHAYEEYGERLFEHLNGHFAVAIWDIPRQCLILARDRVGVRPLFYTWVRGTLLFASEIKAILAAIPEAADIDERGIAEIFTFWGTVGQRTAFKGIQSLPPGHLLVVEERKHRLVRYWDWTFPEGAGRSDLTIEDAAEELRALLTDAVRLQLRSDVPVGAYLSGGLDSSGIAALSAAQAGGTLRTFSVTFDDPEFDESVYQRQVAEHLGLQHTAIRCGYGDIGKAFPDLIWHTEAPVLRTAAVPLMLLSRHVRDSGYKVVLTGDGADEVFGGYDLFKEGKIRRFWASQPQSRWRPLLFRRLYPYLVHSPVANHHFAQSFFGQRLQELDNPFYAHLTRWETTRRIFRLLTPEFRSALERSMPEEDLAAGLPSGFAGWDPLARDQYIEVKTLLQGYLLSSQGDRVSMANSVEGRLPYLDHRIIEHVNALSARYKLRGLREKVLLRRVFDGLLPQGILARVKQPYRAPDSRCFFEDGVPLAYVGDLLSASNLRRTGYFEPEAVAHLVEKCRTGRAIGAADNMALVGLLSTLLLHEHFLDARSRPSLRPAAWH